MSDTSKKVYLQIYATGLRPAEGVPGVTVSVGAFRVPVESVNAHGSLLGLDAIRDGPLRLSLAG